MADKGKAKWARPFFNPKKARDTGELLDMCVRALQQGHGSLREAGLRALAGALERLPPLDELDSRSFKIFALCGICAKELSLKEARLAYRAVGLLALTVRAGAPRILAESFPMLSRTLQDDQALDCLAAVTFAGARKKEDVERSMKAVWDVLFPSGSATERNPHVLVTAVSTWTFLLTTIVVVTDDAAWNATVASLARLLEHYDRAVRMAAGEALAVCVELNLTRHSPREDMDALAAKVSELASEPAGKGVSNMMLPQQKKLFRQIAAFLDHDERPVAMEMESADGCLALKVSTWAKLAQLKFLRRFIGNGFEKHVQGNELFKDYGADEGKVLSIANRKQSSKRKREWGARECNILCKYPYTGQRRPQTLLQIGWQALN